MSACSESDSVLLFQKKIKKFGNKCVEVKGAYCTK